MHILIYLQQHLEANKIAARHFCTLVSFFHSIFYAFLYHFLITPQACIKQHNCYLCSSMILSMWMWEEASQLALFWNFYFVLHTHAHKYGYLFSLSIVSETELNCFQRKLSWSSFALTVERSIVLDDLFYFWALVDLLSTPNLILGMPRENRAEYWYQFIILWTGRAKNRRQMGCILHLWEYTALFCLSCKS